MNIDFNRIRSVFFALCKHVDTPRSLKYWLLFKYGEYAALLDSSIDPNDYTCAQPFALDLLCLEFLSKYKGFPLQTDLRQVALQKFRTSESKCANTNRSIRAFRTSGSSPSVAAVYHLAARKISEILGPIDMVSCFEGVRWGPGATFDLKGRYSSLDDKIGKLPFSVTSGALPIAKAVIQADPHWASSLLEAPVEGPFSLLPTCFDLTSGCRVTTVPKNSKTDRTIAIEPTLNIFLQLGIGGFIRRRLKRFGIDLNDQGLNQNLARIGAKYGDLCTIDLSAASDTISKELVFELLPLDWSILLDRCRSPSMKVEGEWLRLEKFSSMGNGFTFELESLLFYALTWAVEEFRGIKCKTIGVYGDDIICSTDSVPLLREVFEFSGFALNDKKSHWNSLYRESCGKHFFGAFDVTPIFQKEIPDVLEEIYRLANRIRRLAYRMGANTYLDGRFRPAWLAAIHNVDIKHFIPFGFEGDDGLLTTPNEWPAWAVRKSRYSADIRLPNVSTRPKKKRRVDSSALAYWFRENRDPIVIDGSSSLRSWEDVSKNPSNYYLLSRRVLVRANTSSLRGSRRTGTAWKLFPLGTPDVAWVV